METLRADRDEFSGNSAAMAWVGRARRQYGIKPSEAACWFVEVEEGGDSDIRFLSRSPSDCIDYAESLGADAAHRDGFARWTLEVMGYDSLPPRILRVFPRLDEQETASPRRDHQGQNKED